MTGATHIGEEDDGPHVLIAGSGNPYPALDTLNRRIMYLLRDGVSSAAIATSLGIGSSEIADRLNVLRATSLIDHDPPLPSVLVVDSGEARAVVEDARRMGDVLAETVLDAWAEIERGYSTVEARRRPSLTSNGLIMVGARILDLDLLDAFAREGAILPAPPSRPAPGRPDDRCYLWMVAGNREWRGRYGGGLVPLRWPGWALHTFGRFGADDAAGRRRSIREEAALRLGRSEDVLAPEALAERLRVPCVPPPDAERWGEVCRGVTTQLVTRYRERREALSELHAALHSRGRSTLSEFVCWHVHLAAGFAIDVLLERGVFELAPGDFQMAVWFQPEDASDFLRKPNGREISGILI
jgi:hypothetical protein